MTSFIIIIIATCLLMIGFVLYLNKLSSTKRLRKYVPFVITLIIGSAMLIKGFYYTDDLGSLVYTILGTTNLASSLVSLLTASILDLIYIKNKKERG